MKTNSQHNFCYNYRFLSDWLDANPQIKRYELLHELGMSDYRTLQNWIEGNTMVPLTQMMKFCNLYSVPIESFFLDEFADEGSIYTPISEDSQIEPTGGWSMSGRKVGIKTGDPRTETHTESVLPSYCAEYKSDIMDSPFALPQDASQSQAGKAITHQERMHYLDVISQQQKTISELVSEITLRKQE